MKNLTILSTAINIIMRNELLIILLIIVSSCYSNDSIDNYWNKMNLKGKVKILKQINYEAKESFGEIVKGNVKILSQTDFTNTVNSQNNCYQIIFDYTGLIQTETTFNSDGSNDCLYKYFYKENKLIKVERSYYEEQTLLVYNYFSEKPGEITETSLENNEPSPVKIVSHFDTNNNLIEEISYVTFGGDIWDKYIRKSYEYDQNGKLQKLSTYNRDGLIRSYFIQYNTNGDMSTLKYFNSDGVNKYSYSYQYEYDNMNNWTKKFEYSNNKLKFIAERQIEYY